MFVPKFALRADSQPGHKTIVEGCWCFGCVGRNLPAAGVVACAMSAFGVGDGEALDVNHPHRAVLIAGYFALTFAVYKAG